ncbi:MAG: competence/damage-inducible protein A [Ignavibacteriales bacterium]|nr:competence/damage-inducible protein A [Ignavibacteriales bacterium]
MNAIIITVGDELLIGQVINTNQAYIAQQLNGVGVAVKSMLTVGDNEEIMLDAFAQALQDAEIVLVTGGLGPTHDDVTKKVVCKLFHAPLVQNEEALNNVRAIVEKRKVRWNALMEEQAMVPEGGVVIQNSCGTAPGILFTHNNKYFFVFPGVPKEMEEMMQRFVLSFLKTKISGSVILHRTLKTVGVVEAHLAEQLGNIDELFEQHPGTTLAFLPQIFSVRLRISVHDATNESAQHQLARVEKNIRAKIGNVIYGCDEEELEDVVIKLLQKHNYTLAVAESCTGGHLADTLTNVSGSSLVFERGVITYSNQSKVELLDVPAELIERHGAVSKEVAETMAMGIRKISQTTFGLSITGIAGPTGGSAEKPVGLVWLGYSSAKEIFALQYYFGDGRKEIKERATLAALNLLRKKILEKETDQ